MLAISSEYTQYSLDELGNSLSRQAHTHTHTCSLKYYSSFDAQILTKLLSWVNIVSPDITKSPKRKIHFQTERNTNTIVAFVCWLYKMRLHCINSNKMESISIRNPSILSRYSADCTLHAFTHIRLFSLPLSHTKDILEGEPELTQRIWKQLNSDSIGLRAIIATFWSNMRIIRYFIHDEQAYSNVANINGKGFIIETCSAIFVMYPIEFSLFFGQPSIWLLSLFIRHSASRSLFLSLPLLIYLNSC